MLSKDLKQKRASTWEAMKAVIDTAEGENRDLSVDEQTSYDNAEKEFDEFTKRIARAEQVESTERELATSRIQSDPTPEGLNPDDKPEEQYRKAFDSYLRRGITFLSPAERDVLMKGQADVPAEARDLSKLTGGAGGFTVPTTFVKRLLDGLQDEVVMRAIGAEQLTTNSGENLLFPRVAAYGANASITPELTAITFVDDSFEQVEIKAYTYPTGTKISFQLLQDTAVDLEGFVSTRLRERISRSQNNHFINGNGTTQPEGIATIASVGITGAVGPATIPDADVLFDLYHSVKRPYRTRGKWLMSDLMVKMVRKLKDGNEQYLWQPGIQADEPDRILGKPVFTDEDMPDPAALAKSILFGDFSKYLIRDVAGVAVRRLDERYADQLAVGFIAWMRSDGKLLDLNAVKAFAFGAAA